MTEQMFVYTAMENSCSEAPVDRVTKAVCMGNEDEMRLLFSQLRGTPHSAKQIREKQNETQTAEESTVAKFNSRSNYI